MAERLTKKINKTIQDKYSLGSYLYYDFNGVENTNRLLNKLGELEDIMEKYNIDSVEELEELLDDNKYAQNVIVKQLVELKNAKTDRDTWKRACELACEDMCKFVIPCPDIHRKECKSFCDLNKADCYQDYFYQQAKKEENDERN